MRATALLLLLSMILLSTAAWADVPGMINYQGTLTDDDGVALDTTVSMIFSIYDDSTGGSTLWTETQPSVVVTDGIFNVLLGSVNPISDAVFAASSRWLGLQIGGDAELSPRPRIASVGYCFQAAKADSADYAQFAPGLWTDAGFYIYPNISNNFTIYDDSSGYIGLSYVDGTQTVAITNWYNDGASVLHCKNESSNLYGLECSVWSSLIDYGVRSYGEEWGGYFGCGAGGTAVYGDYEYGSGTFGYLGASNIGVYGQHANGNSGYIGLINYGMYGYLATNNVGDYAIYGWGVDASGEDGTSYAKDNTLGAVRGYNYYGNPYTFGVAGYSYLDYNRSGGCFGGKYSAAVWGCHGYKNSAGTEYGGYATAWGSGGGKGTVSTAIGLGSWGDLFGADIHGKVYGVYAEGGDYGLYSHGNVFRDALDVHLQHQGDRTSAVLYTNVSTDVTVQTSGFLTLSSGKSTISFDDNFRQVVSSEVPIVVTVSPTGPCQGVYVSQVSKDGFTVVENNGGKSDVTIAFIAVGRRAGYERPQLPAEVISSEYVDKLSRGLHNDADTQTDGQGLYFEDGQLVVGVHPSTLPDPNKPAEELQQAKHVLHPDALPVRPAEVLREKPSQRNIAPERVQTRQSD